ncbi:MAG: hypothetical protein ING12_12795 [Roseomonas sp.]|nr:hypothetical protein [Roseomonas sp.]
MVTEDQPHIAALERIYLTAVPRQRVAFDGSFVVRSFWEVQAAPRQQAV